MSRESGILWAMGRVSEPISGHVFRVERVRGPVWYGKYRLPDGWQVQKKIGPAFGPRHELDCYLDEFTFRFNRRRARHRGLLFYRLLEGAMATSPRPYKNLIDNSPHS
jgi:hypothetical protein